MPTLPSAFTSIIVAFAPLFRKSVWRCAHILFIGAILAPGKRTVTSALRVMGLSGERRFLRYHRVLSRAVWSCRKASLILLRMLVAAFAPTGPLVLVLDDTIERRWGPQISARGIYRDAVRSSKSHFVKTSGLRWLSLMLLAPVPWRKNLIAHLGRAHLGSPFPYCPGPFGALLPGAQTPPEGSHRLGAATGAAGKTLVARPYPGVGSRRRFRLTRSVIQPLSPGCRLHYPDSFRCLSVRLRPASEERRQGAAPASGNSASLIKASRRRSKNGLAKTDVCPLVWRKEP